MPVVRVFGGQRPRVAVGSTAPRPQQSQPLRAVSSQSSAQKGSKLILPHAAPVLIAPSLEPVLEEVSAFSPATVANLGCGFDFMGCAVEVPQRPFLPSITDPLQA